VLVSTLTGNCEVVHSAEPSLVVEPSAESLSSGIDWYLNLEPVQRRKIGDAARVAAGTFTESASTQAFADTLNQIATHGRTG
jgi:glycosyltransferase involved in cell wall biosynthesis